MPLIVYKSRRYLLRWKKDWDDLLLRVSKKYRKGGLVQWRVAIEKGEFRSFPKSLVSSYTLSKRLTHLKLRKKPEFRKKRLDYYYKNREEIRRKSRIRKDNRRKGVFKESSGSLKEKHGYRSRRVWTDSQLIILITLAWKYRKSRKTVDWSRVLSDKHSQDFPYRDISRLRRFYGSYTRKKGGLKKRRQQALQYKYANYKKYRASQEKSRRIIRNVANEFLMGRLK